MGCGAGRALVELARAYPRSRFVGFDPDPAQIERARANATAAGVADRVRFEASTVDAGPYDVVFTFDVVHDAGDPLGLLRAVRAALRPGGTYVCAEINGADSLAGNLNPFGALYYGVSVLYCLSVSLAAGGPGWAASACRELFRPVRPGRLRDGAPAARRGPGERGVRGAAVTAFEPATC